MGDKPNRNAARNRRRHDRRRALTRFASHVRQAGLLDAVEFAVKRRAERLTALAILRHHPDDRPAMLIDHEQVGPSLVLPIHNDTILLAGDALVVPLPALEAVILELLGVGGEEAQAS